MRDLRIRVQNFLSHEDTELILDGLDAAIVIGKNGSGKSSLMVDAPMIALFGQARADNLDDYIKNGKDTMTVEYDFSILDDQRYRIVFKRSKKTARGASSLEFGRIDKAGNKIEDQGLTAGSIDETRALIEKTIATDFDTLMHTSVYEAEEADFFCRARPAERMKLFSKIWDLEKYAKYAQAARDKWLGKKDSPGLQADIASIEGKISLSKRRMGEIGGKKDELTRLRVSADKEAQNVSGLEAKKGDLQKRIGKLEIAEESLKRVGEEKDRTADDIGKVSGQHAGVLKKIERFDKILKNQDTVRAKVVEEQKKNGDISTAEKEMSAIELHLERLRTEADATRKEYQAKVDAEDVKRSKIEAEILQEQSKEAALQKASSEVVRKEEQLKHLCVDADKLKGIACHPDLDPTYINEACRFIKDAVQARGEIPKLEKKITLERDRIDSDMTTLQEELRLLEEKKAKFISLVTDIKREQSEAILAIEAKQKEATAKKSTERAKIEASKKELEEIKRFTKLLPEIDLAEAELPNLKKEEGSLFKRCNELIAARDQREKEINELSESLKARGELDEELRSVENALAAAVSARDEVTKKIGSIESEIAQLEPLKSQVAEDEKKLETLGSEKALYQILEEAFKQIPYILVATGVGAVETIANEILAMISSNGLAAQVRTEKEVKTTKILKDEIYLFFQDNDGRKEYKLLSQGEKVRAAIALRLAVSEAQAHRRGVRIDKFIADDVFGALDAEGIENMKEAMRDLKNRFKFMAILTHIEAAQDIFPTKIMFSKDQTGSHVEVQQE